MADTGQALANTGETTTKGIIPTQLTQLFGERALRQLGLIVGLAAAIAAGIGLFYWAQEPAYRPLYGRISEQDATAVIDALQAANIAYKLDSSTGAVLVPAGEVHAVRLKLAAQGLPQSGGMGYELLQREQGFGTSQFMENARFNRALETELARSISTLQGVESARVHLAIPKQSVFIRERSQPSASVLVNLFPGRNLSDGQVAAVVHMVASSVPELVDERVTLVDQRGRVLTRKEEGLLGATSQQLEYKQLLEEDYVRRIENLLTPMLGSGRVRAQVNARLDFTVEENTQELFDPDGRVVRSEQLSEQETQRGLLGGVPGALTNQPPQAGTLQPGEVEPEQDERPLEFNRSNTRNYEVSKTIRHSRRPQGAIERLSLAVLVDDKSVIDDAGQLVREPLSTEELDRISALVQQAVGFDAARGDTINVISAPFQSEEQLEPMRTPFLEQPWLWNVGKLLLAAVLGLVLILSVVRPLIRALLSTESRPAGGSATDEQLRLAGAAAVAQLPAPSSEPAPARLMDEMSYEDALTTARQVVSQEPAVAASVVKNWLSDDD